MKKKLRLLIKIFIIWNIAVWSASTLYNVFSPGANEVEQILCQEWNNGEGITDDSMILTKKFL